MESVVASLFKRILIFKLLHANLHALITNNVYYLRLLYFSKLLRLLMLATVTKANEFISGCTLIFQVRTPSNKPPGKTPFPTNYM